MHILSKALYQVLNYKNTGVLLQANDKARLFSNFVFLFILRIANYLFPLITLPYLVRTIGVSYYGLFNLAMVYATYFKVFTDYGFNLSATRDISIHRDNHQKVSEIFNSVFLIKIVLTLLSFTIVCAIVFSFQEFRQDYLVYMLAFLTVVGDVLFPVWFFQGVEKMEYITYINVSMKFVMTVLIFIVVKRQSDFLHLILLNSICSVLTGFISLSLVLIKFKIKVKLPSLNRVKIDLLAGWYLFISTCLTNIYINSNIVFLGLFFSNTIVGYFAMADKVISAVRGVVGMIFQCIYPYACKKAVESFKEIRLFFKKIFIFVVVCFLVLGILVFFFSNHITLFVAGTIITETSEALKILSFIPLIVALNIFPYQLLLIFNFRKSYLIVLGSGCALNFILNYTLGRNFGIVGTSVTVLVTEIYITMFLYIILEWRHRKYSLVKGNFHF